MKMELLHPFFNTKSKSDILKFRMESSGLFTLYSSLIKKMNLREGDFVSFFWIKETKEIFLSKSTADEEISFELKRRRKIELCFGSKDMHDTIKEILSLKASLNTYFKLDMVDFKKQTFFRLINIEKIKSS